MKKAIALVLALLMLLGLAACGGKEDDDSGRSKDTNKNKSNAEEITDAPAPPENAVGALRFDVPEDIKSVEHITEQTKDGKVTQFTVTYTFTNSFSVGYAYAKDMDLGDTGSVENLETTEVNGRSYYLVFDGTEYYAYTQAGKDAYAVMYIADSAEASKSMLEETLKTLRYEEEEVLSPADLDLYDITYTVDDSLTLAGYNITETTDADGKVTEKTVQWKYGDNLSDPDFRIRITVYKNDTLDNVTDEDAEYEDKTIGDITYTMLHVSEGYVPYDYLVQHGSDVYEIRNAGRYTGWGTTRSTESEEAFTAFVESVRFK